MTRYSQETNPERDERLIPLDLERGANAAIATIDDPWLAALKTSAQVRRLLMPMVQVNIADQQVNVGSAGAAADSRRRRARQYAGNGIG
jgi:hypothetical protein